jgi:hypothetical protein
MGALVGARVGIGIFMGTPLVGVRVVVGISMCVLVGHGLDVISGVDMPVSMGAFVGVDMILGTITMLGVCCTKQPS